MTSPINANQVACFLPILAVGTFSAARLTAGAVGLGTKGAGSMANSVGQEKISQYLNSAGDKLISFATRNPETEFKIVGDMCMVGAAIGIGSLLLPENNLSTIENVKRFIGMTKTLSPLEYIGEHPSILGWAASGLMGISLFAEVEKPKAQEEDFLAAEKDDLIVDIQWKSNDKESTSWAENFNDF